MAIRGTMIKSATKYVSILTEKAPSVGAYEQEKQLKKLLQKAKSTEFGNRYNFSKILKSENILDAYRQEVPVFDYHLMFNKYWHKTLSGVADVSWPGKIENFALTSGTTGAASKRIPVSKQMIQSIKKVSVRQLLGLSKLNLPNDFYEKDILFLGGSTTLTQINDQFEGDLSGIVTGKVPNWIAPFSKPEKEIRALENWNDKIDEIVKRAPEYDLGIICGVPSWMQILIERIVDHYGLTSIHQIWPNLKIYVHGGVNFEPYMSKFNQLFDSRVIYLDTYLCSEGFFAFQSVESDSLQLLTKSNVYFEFIPFNDDHFNADGELINQNSLTINEVVEGVDYALLVSTSAGAWRYLIGDTIKFTNLASLKIKITGRTKHFLNLCGEHLSIDNMTDALTKVAFDQHMDIREFAVIGAKTKSDNFKHIWFLGCDNSDINKEQVQEDLDYALCQLNMDYMIERKFALAEVEIKTIPNKVFYDFMKIKDKYGAQHKFPRVLKGRLADDWVLYLQHLQLI
ncbi:GH3 family domain-containing protein [Crocinitomix catalasitica]|uniref:GH3 family domain-containing protein n=1 Tax=Crocinitomix catalasitica TaxID=184607 RepID=UPI0004882EEF|nr:GH3 auxin-responsive promoter family protein [Crocinitomix catalasitica]